MGFYDFDWVTGKLLCPLDIKDTILGNEICGGDQVYTYRKSDKKNYNDILKILFFEQLNSIKLLKKKRNKRKFL